MDYETVSRRAASGFMAFAALNLVGVVFSLAPGFLALLGLGAGAIWPGWIAGGWSKIKQSLEETKIKGRGGNLLKQEQNRDGFSFFVDGNGGKQFYRTTFFLSEDEATKQRQQQILTEKRQREMKKKKKKSQGQETGKRLWGNGRGKEKEPESWLARFRFQDNR